jgi:hypothetical protein
MHCTSNTSPALSQRKKDDSESMHECLLSRVGHDLMLVCQSDLIIFLLKLLVQVSIIECTDASYQRKFTDLTLIIYYFSKHTGSDEHINDLFSRSNAEIMNRINLLSRGALREDMSSPGMGYSQTGLSGINSSANFNPFQFGTSQGPRRGVSSHYSFPPFARSRPAPGSQSPFQEIGEVDLHHSMPNISYSHEMLPIDEELGPLNHSLPNLNHSIQDLNYTHQPANLNHSVPNLSYTHEEAKLNRSVPNLSYTHEDAEPIPYDQYSPLNRKRSLTKDSFSSNTAATSVSSNNQARSAETESDDLLTCLVKLTETTIGDDNPFEPIPLANSSEHMISVDHGRFDDGDMTSEFGEDETESLGRGGPRGIDV